ncbi:MAG TPA: hypothetical protein VK963_00850, partial [Candidatus Saccharimonadales bacterium]|nr:hypothetical protein [Candidatus Saccharimonadales bacterium]
TEAMIYLEQGKVVAIQAFANPENRSVLHRQTKARVGSTKQAVKDRVRARLQDIDPSRDVAKRSGLKVNNTRSISYFLTDPCEANEQIQSLALVLKDKQGILVDKLADTSEIKCGAEAD